MTHDEYAALSWWQQWRPSIRARRWRVIGRDWALVGEQERSELSHRMADYFEQPVWLQILTSNELNTICNRFAQIRREQRGPR